MTFGDRMPSKLWRDLETGTFHLSAVWFTTVDEKTLLRRRTLFRRIMKPLTDMEAL